MVFQTTTRTEAQIEIECTLYGYLIVRLDSFCGTGNSLSLFLSECWFEVFVCLFVHTIDEDKEKSCEANEWQKCSIIERHKPLAMYR